MSSSMAYQLFNYAGWVLTYDGYDGYDGCVVAKKESNPVMHHHCILLLRKRSLFKHVRSALLTLC